MFNVVMYKNMGNACGNIRDVLVGNISNPQFMAIYLLFKMKRLLGKKRLTIGFYTYDPHRAPEVT